MESINEMGESMKDGEIILKIVERRKSSISILGNNDLCVTCEHDSVSSPLSSKRSVYVAYSSWTRNMYSRNVPCRLVMPLGTQRDVMPATYTHPQPNPTLPTCSYYWYLHSCTHNVSL